MSGTSASMTFEEQVVLLADKSDYAFPFLMDTDGKKIVVLFKHEGGEPANRMVDMVWKRLKCQTCRSRTKKFSRYSNVEEDPLFLHPTKKAQLPPGHDELFACQEEVVHTPIMSMVILRKDQDLMDGLPSKEGDFYHYHISIPAAHRSECNDLIATRYEKALKRYLPSQMTTLIETLLPRPSKEDPRPRSQRFEDIRASLELMESSLVEIPYGEKLQHSVTWLLRIVQHFKEMDRFLYELTDRQKWWTMARILLWTSLSPDGLHNAVSPVFQQAYNNVLPVLGNAHNKKALISILTIRLSPTNYQRPSQTKELTLGAIQNAEKVLGDFSNRVMTQEEATRLPHAITLLSTTSSSLQAFQNMRHQSVKLPLKTAYGFANRSGNAASFTRLSELLDFLREHPDHRLFIKVTSTAPAYVAHTTLRPELLSVPHFWAYMTDPTFWSRMVEKEYEEVSVIVPLYKYTTYKNIIFLLRHLRQIPSFKNCCFPEFLSLQHRRTCRDAFERLNKEMPISLSDHPMAVGCGLSVINAAGDLHRPLHLRLDDQDLVLHKF